MCGHIEVKDYEWFYIILLSNNINIQNVKIITPTEKKNETK
jgi:hypothetical protein